MEEGGLASSISSRRDMACLVSAQKLLRRRFQIKGGLLEALQIFVPPFQLVAAFLVPSETPVVVILAAPFAAQIDLGGEIALLRTEEGKGSTFRVRLRPAAMTEEPRQVSLRPAAKRGRILVVDDDEHVGASIERVLSREHDVFFAIGVRAAIDLLRDDQRFDLVLCDLRMPAGGGVAVFREIQRMAPALARRFVIVTGDPSAMQLEEIRAELSFPVIEKPFDPQTLRGLVREALAADGSP